MKASLAKISALQVYKRNQMKGLIMGENKDLHTKNILSILHPSVGLKGETVPRNPK